MEEELRHLFCNMTVTAEGPDTWMKIFNAQHAQPNLAAAFSDGRKI